MDFGNACFHSGGSCNDLLLYKYLRTSFKLASGQSDMGVSRSNSKAGGSMCETLGWPSPSDLSLGMSLHTSTPKPLRIDPGLRLESIYINKRCLEFNYIVSIAVTVYMWFMHQLRPKLSGLQVPISFVAHLPILWTGPVRGFQGTSFSNFSGKLALVEFVCPHVVR